LEPRNFLAPGVNLRKEAALVAALRAVFRAENGRVVVLYAEQVFALRERRVSRPLYVVADVCSSGC